ncbi:hypothetical protein [Brachybacterium saurashtrense]|uniref:Uncharacterized protein n=1 Tax=Brachybacterium saurashtrense TaxID=556288 RepID=A0A345YQJ0_9MICO|nr:hypothetical protein [Brachybacterium saurashtrense]AXK46192.1 hypothetical protein DWV08_11620 [Brachybacterium saurashtrense]RRR23932.1 hypothetical protein DXU92_03370 [Brachybacterium saurashtrense]
MAPKALPTLGPRGKGALSTAKWALPLLIAGARWLSENPELLEKVKLQISRLLSARTSTIDGMLETITVLRESVDYLAGSADDEAEARQARDWAEQLDHCEQAAKLLTAPGAPSKERKALKKRIDALRTEIMASFIAEQGEDATAERSATT